MINVDKILENLDEFPTLPTIYSNLLECISNPRSTVNDVAQIISRDQSAALKILKSVNSPLYGVSKKVETIKDAVFHLGFNEIKNLVVALSVVTTFKNIKATKNFSLLEFWKHSVAVGVISKLIGVTCGEKNTENYFLAGVIHDIGKLFFVQFFNEEYDKVIENAFSSKIELSKAEMNYFGVNHIQIGEKIAVKWQLPVVFRSVIKHYQDLDFENGNSMITTSVALADYIADLLELGLRNNGTTFKPNPKIWEVLKLNKGDLLELYPKIIENYNQSIQILIVN
ncbi:MAG: HDOD domain-containing protein [Candidatus Kapabacteria bacterium]|nr:HDOD domain-containing protein [Candidatus Kapabacteria bacterium]